MFGAEKKVIFADILAIDGYASRLEEFIEYSESIFDHHEGDKEFSTLRVAYKSKFVEGEVKLTITKCPKKNELVVEIDSITTMPNRGGLGRLIVDKVRILAEQIGAREVIIDSLDEAEGFWQKMGATPKGNSYSRAIADARVNVLVPYTLSP